MTINIYQKISDWLLDCPKLGGYLYFNVIPLENSAASVNSNSSSSILNEYIDGSKEVRLLFYVNLVKEYDEGGTSDLNLEAIDSFDEIIKFFEEKDLKEEYPDLGYGYVVNEIGAVNKAPEVYLSTDSPNVARYEGQFYIEYLERKEK